MKPALESPTALRTLIRANMPRLAADLKTTDFGPCQVFRSFFFMLDLYCSAAVTLGVMSCRCKTLR